MALSIGNYLPDKPAQRDAAEAHRVGLPVFHRILDVRADVVRFLTEPMAPNISPWPA